MVVYRNLRCLSSLISGVRKTVSCSSIPFFNVVYILFLSFYSFSMSIRRIILQWNHFCTNIFFSNLNLLAKKKKFKVLAIIKRSLWWNQGLWLGWFVNTKWHIDDIHIKPSTTTCKDGQLALPVDANDLHSGPQKLHAMLNMKEWGFFFIIFYTGNGIIIIAGRNNFFYL